MRRFSSAALFGALLSFAGSSVGCGPAPSSEISPAVVPSAESTDGSVPAGTPPAAGESAASVPTAAAPDDATALESPALDAPTNSGPPGETMATAEFEAELEKQVEALIEAENFGAAYEAVRPVLEKEPNNVAALVLRSRVHRMHENYEAALVDAMKAVQLEPRNPKAWLAQGWSLSRNGAPFADGDAIRETFDRALELDDTSALAWQGRGQSYLYESKYEQALPELTKAIESGDRDGWSYFHRGEAYVGLEKYAEAVEDFSNAIKVDAEEPYFHSLRAYCLCELKRFDEALADYERIQELQPDDPSIYTYRGAANVMKGDYQQASKDFITEIERTDGHAGKGYQATRNVPLSEESLRHGEEQLKAILRDRPAMAEHVKPGDRLWTWTVRQLAGEEIGEPIYWNPQSLRTLPACHQSPSETDVGAIQISSDPEVLGYGDDTAFECLWSCLVFELHNIRLAREFFLIHQRANVGQISEDEFVRATCQVERKAEQLQFAFYAHFFLPWAEEAGFRESASQFWVTSIPEIESEAGMSSAVAYMHPDYVGAYRAQFKTAEAAIKMHTGDYAAAREMLKGVLASSQSIDEAEVAQTRLMLGDAALALGEREGAFEEYQRAAALDDRFAGERQTPAGARIMFGKPLHDETKIAAAAHLMRGDAALEAGDVEFAIADFDRAIELDESNDAAFVLRARAFKEQGDVDRAFEDLGHVLRKNPEHVSAIATRVVFRRDNDEMNEALADLNEFVRLAPRQGWGWITRSEVCIELGDFESALADLNQAIQIIPEASDALLLRAQAYVHQRDFDNALVDCAVLCNMSPEYAPAYFIRGKVKYLQGEFAAGDAEFDRVLRLDPNASYVTMQRAIWRIASEDFVVAIQNAEKLLESDDVKGWGLALKGEALFRLGRFGESLQAVEAAMELDPEMATNHVTRGQLFAKDGNSNEALEGFARAIELAPRTHLGYAARAKFFSECKDASVRDTSKAIADATRACELTFWKDHDCFSCLAGCHAEAGDFAKAIEWQTKAVELAQGDWKPLQERRLETLRAGKTFWAAREEKAAAQ